MKSDFEVTEKAGAFVAGQRNPGVGQVLSLTEAQAEYPLIMGELRRPEKPEPKAKAVKAAASSAE